MDEASANQHRVEVGKYRPPPGVPAVTPAPIEPYTPKPRFAEGSHCLLAYRMLGMLRTLVILVLAGATLEAKTTKDWSKAGPCNHAYNTTHRRT